MTIKSRRRPAFGVLLLAILAGWHVASLATAPLPFRITVDGQPLGAVHRADAVDGADVAQADPLHDMDIQVRFDGLRAQPQMQVQAEHLAHDPVLLFRAAWNYQAFVSKGQVELLDSAGGVLDVLPLDPRGRALWIHAGDPAAVGDADAGANMPSGYRLRLYDISGRFDLGADQPLPQPGSAPGAAKPALDPLQDQAVLRNIQIRGGTVVVSGQRVPDGYTVASFGQTVDVADGQFLARQILPPGSHQVPVSVQQGGRMAMQFRRDLLVPDEDWFWVALADLTWQDMRQGGAVVDAEGNASSRHDAFATGRVAMYMKGRVSGRTLLTAMLDTGEDDLDALLGNLDDRDPRQLLRRLDPDQYYPVYGDQSRTEEDAPTQGRVYLRLDRGDSRVLWGNYETRVTGTEFAQLDRGLHGGLLRHVSDDTTGFGERRSKVTLFASDPGTVPGRDEFLGTGGSVYYLQRQDVVIGSDRLRVEVRDQVNNLVLETRDLRAGTDYDIDYIQGRILLSRPLRSRQADGDLVREGSLPGNPVVLVARYEFTPGLSELDGMTLGGRGSHWFGDRLQLAATGQRDRSADADQTLAGVDATLRLGEASYLKAEAARTEGQGFGTTGSTDGGFLFSSAVRPGQSGEDATALRLEARLHNADLGLAMPGSINAWVERQEAGFSGTGRPATDTVRRGGVQVTLQPSAPLKVSASLDRSLSDAGADLSRVALQADLDVGGGWHLGAGMRHADARGASTASPALAGAPGALGSPTVAGGDQPRDTVLALQGSYQAPDDGWRVLAFAQDAVSGKQREQQRRAGVGGEWQLSENQRLGGEVSLGDDGLALTSSMDVALSDNHSIYLTYDLLEGSGRPDGVDGSTLGRVTLGGRSRFGDHLSVWGEERYGMVQGLVEQQHAWGLEYQPADAWSFTGTAEQGTVEDPVNGDFERSAWSLSAGYSQHGLRLGSMVELRSEDGRGEQRDRTTWLLRNSAALDLDANWQALARLNMAFSDSDQSTIRDSDFTELVLAAAWRPGSDAEAVRRLNGSALFSYTYMRDMAPFGQITAGGTSGAPKQRSHVLNLDGDWQLLPKLRLGGRIGVRYGEVSLGRDSDTFVDSTAALLVLRADWMVREHWDLLVEGRGLRVTAADDLRKGILLALYRRFGHHVRVGGGYSFVAFSEDLTDQQYNSRGWFLNLTGAL